MSCKTTIHQHCTQPQNTTTEVNRSMKKLETIYQFYMSMIDVNKPGMGMNLLQLVEFNDVINTRVLSLPIIERDYH